MKKIILLFGIALALLLSGCTNDFLGLDAGGRDGNVTITIGAGDNARTLRPNDIDVSAFSRIEVEVTNADRALQTKTLTNGQTSASFTLATGDWKISAKGFMVIDGNEYEAAYGEASITVGSGRRNASINLSTGIFEGKPGVFTYNVGFPESVTAAILEINPLNDPNGYQTTITGKSADIFTAKYGSFELFPGYYLLTIRAQIGNTMALWNELVHIYSGRETLATHTFVAANFSTTITLSGTVKTGELGSSKVTAVTVHAYSDEYYVNRIASVPVTLSTSKTGAYYEGPWSITIPGTFSDAKVYFALEETIAGTDNEGTPFTKTFTRRTNLDGDEIPAAGKDDIDLLGSFTWYVWANDDVADGISHTVNADGTITVTTTQKTTEDWDTWKMQAMYFFPAEVSYKYAYEFEAWTQSGSRPLQVNYINDYHWNQFEKAQDIALTTAHQQYIILSDTAIDAYTRPQLEFRCGSNTTTGTFSIKISKIEKLWDYEPSAPSGVERFTATAQSGGVLLKANFAGVPKVIEGLQFENETTGAIFQVYWGAPLDEDGNQRYSDTYEMIFPYVMAGEEYTFRLNMLCGDISMVTPRATVTATSGRGELMLTNAGNIALIKEGDNLRLNTTPNLSDFTKTNMGDAWYHYEIATGTSWMDHTAKWRAEIHQETPAPIDLMNPAFESWGQNLGDYLSQVAGKTCFATFSYRFNYDNPDIYPIPSLPTGYFSTAVISSTSFTYPNVVPDTFTATPHAEGVMLTVDLTKVPEGTQSVQFHLSDWTGGRLWEGLDTAGELRSYYDDQGNYLYDEWVSWPIRKWRGQDKVEIIYPFVQAGRTYSFAVEYGGVGTIGEATVTANAGLGELNITNRGDLGMYYNSREQTMYTTGTPNLTPYANSQYIDPDMTGWFWQIYKGHNWDDQGDLRAYPNFWGGGKTPSKTPISSVKFDNTFDPELGNFFSNTVVFVNYLYQVNYRGFSFEVQVSAESSYFTFPNFDPLADGRITTPFDTNSDLDVSCSSTVYQGSDLYVSVYVYNDERYYGKTIHFAWYIDGVLQTGYTSSSAYIPVPTTMSLGTHYGLAVVTIDGVPFAQEFSFRVYNY